MGIQCTNCGRFVEPTDEAIESKICGYCSGKFDKEKVRECFDGSPCTKLDQNCNKCEALGF